ncbi:MAG TPA: DUF5615 family PIN-like protein [Pirellulaceae bacterium]|nr:DUF5615 family PIN-like protein [Pirellulaceae bacterium]
MLKGYTDEHVSHAIVRSLRARGMDVESVTERGGQGTPDDRLLDEALAEERVMLTCDTDFLRLADKRWAAGIKFAPIFFWAQQHTVGHVVRQVIQLAATHSYDEACSRVFYM